MHYLSGKIWVYDVGESLALPGADEWGKFAHTLQDMRVNKSGNAGDIDEFDKEEEKALLPFRTSEQKLGKEMASSLFFSLLIGGLERRTCTLMTSNAFMYPSLIKISE